MAFQGSLKELPLPDIIQLVSVSGKTGVFSLRRDGEPDGEIFLRGGQIVHAHIGELRSEERRVGKECRSRWSPYH